MTDHQDRAGGDILDGMQSNTQIIDGYIELISVTTSGASICISGWRHTNQVGLQFDVGLDLVLGSSTGIDVNTVSVRGDCLYFKRDDLSSAARSFLIVISSSQLKQDGIPTDLLHRVVFQDGLEVFPTDSLQVLPRQSHLKALSVFAIGDLTTDAAQWWAELEKPEPLSKLAASAWSANPKPPGYASAKQPETPTHAERFESGMIESVGPLLISGWIRVDNDDVATTLTLRTPSSIYNAITALHTRLDLTSEALGFEARAFSFPIPVDIPIEDIDRISIELSGFQLRPVKSFVIKTPIFFRLESIAGGLVEGVLLDLRQPSLSCAFEVYVGNVSLATIETSLTKQIQINDATFQGKFGFFFDIAAFLGWRRTEVTFRLAGTSVVLGEAILDGTVNYRPLRLSAERSGLIGKVDQVGPHFVGGWIQMAGTADPVLELRINGKPFQRVTARRHRADVTSVTGQDARGFLIALPVEGLAPGNNKIEVWDVANKSALPSVPNVISGPPLVGSYEISPSGISGSVNASFIRSDSCLEVLFAGKVVFEHRLQLMSKTSAGPQAFFIPAPERRIDELRSAIRLMPGNLALNYEGNKAQSMRGKLRSNFEGLHNGALTGWLFDDGDEMRRLSILVMIDGKLLAEAVASDLRSDLRSIGLSSLNHGFKLVLPAILLDGREHILEVVEVASRFQLIGSPLTVRFPRSYPDTPRPQTPHLNGFTPPRALAKRTVRTSHTPDFSLIILNKDAGEVLERVFESIRDYLHTNTIEIIVVDHASADSSRAIIEKWSALLPIRYMWQEGDNTFSFSNNYAAKSARGRRLAFVNNDIVFTQDVLARIAEYMEEHPDVGLVGIKLLELRKTAFAEALNDFKVHHLGIGFVEDPATGRIRPAEILDDADNLWRSFARCDVASVTGAFCVIDADDYAAIGGFDEAFFYGFEDVALGLNVRTKLGKRVVSLNDVTSFHHRGFMRLSGKMSPDFMGRVRHNDEILDVNYARKIRRDFRRSVFSGDWIYAIARFTVAFLIFENGPTAQAGDLFTAQELAAELVKLLDCDVMFVSAFDDWTKVGNFNVIINMRNEFDIRDIAGLNSTSLRIAWMRNNFEDWLDSQTLPEYDIVLCSSQAFIQEVYNNIGLVAELLEIATNPQAMSQGIPRRDLMCDVVFNGSFAGANRTLSSEWEGVTLPFSFKVIGSGWQGTPLERFWHGFIPYDQMPDVYASATIVIDDANQSAREWGGTNSRVFDATTSRRVVITNSIRSSVDTFDGKLPVWTTGQDLISQIQTLLSDEPTRQSLANDLADITMLRHTYTDRARKLTTLIRDGAQLRRISIKVAAPSNNTPEVWGDVHFATLLATELRRLKYTVRIETRDKWYSAPGYADVSLVLRGLAAAPRNRSAINLLWVISHPDDVSRAELGDYDHVFGSSVESCRRFAEMGATSTSLLMQCATVPPLVSELEYALRANILYVGNTRGVMRDGVRLLENTGLDYDLAGYGWDNFVSINKVIAERIPYEQVCALYGRAKVVVNDHWPDMREWGIVSNRVFDVLAAGGFVITDLVPGLESIFGDIVPTYTNAASVLALVERAVTDEQWRSAAARTGQQQVLAEHTFRNRALEIDKQLRSLDI